MKEAILSGQKITKSFGDNTVLHGIDIELFDGDFTVIMGSSGSGKSILLYALSGMDRISSGQLIYCGRDITNASEKELTRLRSGDFGFAFQRTHLISNLTLDENIRMVGLIGALSEKESRQRTDTLIARMNLDGAKDRLPSRVSGGEAQRAAVARAVINTPSLLFADEPTGALNRANSEEVLNLLSSLHSEGQSVLLVTHDKEAALRGNRILYLEDGSITGYSDNEGQLLVYDGSVPYRFLTAGGEELPIPEIAPGTVYISPALCSSLDVQTGDTIQFELSRSNGIKSPTSPVTSAMRSWAAL